MWTYAIRELEVAGSGYYVGDSKDDANLAEAAGVPFHHVTLFFGTMHPS